MIRLFLLGFIIVALLALLTRWRGRSRFVAVPPLYIADDDPLMVEAIGRAHTTMPEFRRLIAAKNGEPFVKIAVPIRENAHEHVWAGLEGFEGDQVVAKIVSTPQHARLSSGQRLTVPLTALSDWQIVHSDGTLSGGYTQRAMLQRAREQRQTLPPDLIRLATLLRPLPDTHPSGRAG